MKFKSLLLAFIVGASAQAFAAEYYVTPEGAGSKDGSSWENAFDTEAFKEQALKNADGDIYNLAAGTYKPSACIIFKKGTYATVKGNAEGERTILSGLKHEGSAPKNGDLSRLMRFQTVTGAGVTTKPVVIENIDFTCVFTNISKDATDDGSAGVAGVGALYVNNSGCVTVKDCKFYNNWADGALGGPAVLLNQSDVKFVNCEFRGNSSNYSGAAVRLTNNEMTNTARFNKGNYTFESCVFKNNTTYHDNGGAILYQSGASLTLIDCTLFGNKAVKDGAAICVATEGEKRAFAWDVKIINTTMAANNLNETITVTTPSEVEGGEATKTEVPNEGSQICGFVDYKLKMVNNIVVSSKDHVKATDVAAANFTSGGYNYVGATENELTWLDTDNQAADNDYASIFGNNTLKDNKLMPYVYVQGASSEQLDAATAEWGLPADISFAGRGTDVTPGSYAVTDAEIKANNETTNAINSIGEVEVRIVNHGAGLYSVEGYEGMVEVYSLSGARVMNVAAPAIDLGGFAKGVYVLRAGSATVKVVR